MTTLTGEAVYEQMKTLSIAGVIPVPLGALQMYKPFIEESPSILAEYLTRLITPDSLGAAMTAFTEYLIEGDRLVNHADANIPDAVLNDMNEARESVIGYIRESLVRQLAAAKSLEDTTSFAISLRTGGLVTIEDVLRELPYILLF